MTSALIYNTECPSIAHSETVAQAIRRMLDDRVSDLPVVDGTGKLLGMFKLESLFAVLLPKAALMDYGMPDLSFVSDTIEQLQEKMRAIEDQPVSKFIISSNHVVNPTTSPLEIVLLLYKGANVVPVVAPDSGRLVGMATARDVLAALQGGGTK